LADLSEIVKKRRTFGIISHPDAGKTTLTEKLLLFGGAIQLAGEVKAKGNRRRARSDWMKVEHASGLAATEQVYRDVLEGKVTPEKGMIVSLWEK